MEWTLDDCLLNPQPGCEMCGSRELVSQVAIAEESHRSHTTAALSEMFGRGLIYAAVLALQPVVMIVVTPVTVRSLSKMQFGRLVTAFTLVQLLVMVLGFGMGAAIQRLHSEDDGNYRRTRGLLGFSLALALCATILADISGPIWASLLRLGPYGSTLRFGVWAAGFAAMVTLMAQFFRSEDRLAAFTALMLPFAIGSPLVGLAFILWIHPSASEYLAGMCIGEAIAVVLGILLSRPAFLPLSERNIALSGLAFTLPLVPNGVAYQTLNMGDRIIVQNRLGEFAVGRYQLAYNAAAMVVLVLTLLNQAWVPKIFGIKDLEARRAVLAELRDEVYLLLRPLVLGVTLVAPIVLRILAPPSYQTNGLLLVVSLVAISSIPYAAFQSNTRTLMVFSRTRSLIWAAPFAAIVNIALNIALVPVWGLNASALATLIGYAVLAWTTGFFSRGVAQLSATGSRIWTGVALAAVASLATIYLPVSIPFMVLRFLLAMLCAVWAARDVVKLVKGTRRIRRSSRPNVAEKA